MYRSECWLQTPERANYLGAQREKNVLDLHCDEKLILDDQNSAALEGLLHGVNPCPHWQRKSPRSQAGT